MMLMYLDPLWKTKKSAVFINHTLYFTSNFLQDLIAGQHTQFQNLKNIWLVDMFLQIIELLFVI